MFVKAMLSTRAKRRSGGFSLIELLIVIAIILIILAIAVPKLGSARMQAQAAPVLRRRRFRALW